MTCSSTYPCPLCLAKKGLLNQTGVARTWEEIITLSERWRLETGEDPAERKNYGCCHNVPLLGLPLSTSLSALTTLSGSSPRNGMASVTGLVL